VIFSDLRDRNSELVKTALERRCQICKAPVGEPCVTLTEGTPIYDKWGSYCHIMRADGMPYSTRKAS
jgi:hypothetical protein